MKKHTIARSALTQFSSFSANFGKQQVFHSFLETPFSNYNDLETQIQKKSAHYSSESRKILVDTLHEQLAKYISSEQQKNLDLLALETTFTVTTGHQLTLFGGPMYLLYKVLHIVKLAENFNANSTSNKLVPVFWMASEDHDLDEVRSTFLFNQKLSWNTTQTGAVGEMHMEDFNEVKSQFAAFFEGKESAIQSLLAINLKENYASYVQEFLSVLFADLGVLVLQPNTPQLKSLAKDFFRKELEQGLAFNAVQDTTKQIEQLGYKGQANAREINLFYLKEQARLRIERSNDDFTIGEAFWTAEKLYSELDKHPERFSPNVILRPVYQETILPNLVYVGGGGEMAYWIQLKKVFNSYHTLFPLIQQRISIHLIDAATKKKIEKTGIGVEEFFQSKEVLRKLYLQKHAENEIDFQEVTQAFEVFKQKFVSKAMEIDPALSSMVAAELARMDKQNEGLEQRIVKQLKQKHEGALTSIDFVVDKFIPENTLQERYFHWGQFVPTGEIDQFLKKLLDEIDPFEQDLIVLDLSE